MKLDRFACGMLLSCCVAWPLAAQTQLSELGRRQIAELLADKDQRTPAQIKLASHLIYAARTMRGQRITASVERLPLVMDTLHLNGNLVEVDLKGDISDDLAKAVTALGGQVESAFPKYRAMRAWIPLLAAEQLAERADVSSIQPAAVAHTAAEGWKPPRQFKPAVKPLQPFRSRNGVLFSPFFAAPDTDQGGLIGEGFNIVHGMGDTGSGIKIGVMSDGVNSLSSLQTNGQLPMNITVLPGQAGNGDEGTALLDVVYNMAPGAQLFFATANSGSAATMASNIDALVSNYHIDILVDDVNWSDEGFFQDTNVSIAINSAAAAGVLCFTAAGNNNNLDSATSGSWLGDFADSGSTIGGLGSMPYSLHSFGQGVALNPVLPQPDTDSPGLWFILQWSDPWDCSTNNYDLFVLNSLDETIGAGTNVQSCGGLPPEQYIAQGALNSTVIIAKAPSAAVRALQLNTGRAELELYSDNALQGHSGSANEVSVAAADVGYTVNPPAIGGGAIFTGGSANPMDLISSDGPRSQFFDQNGNLLNPTAANPYTIGGGGGITLLKVDITGSDGVQTDVTLYNPFGGTSAAAPHVAALGAILKAADSYLSNADIVNAMKCTALPVTKNFVQPNGVNQRTQGAGIAMANLAIQAISSQVTIRTTPSNQSVTIAGSGCNPGNYTTPVQMTLPSDAVCTVTLNTPTIAGPAGSRQVFTAWSDATTSNPKTFTVPVCGPATYSAAYQQQYLLTTNSFPSAGGTVAASPTSNNGYYPAGTLVQLTGTPANGYSFGQWSNDSAGTSSSVWVPMNAPKNVTANFKNPALSASTLGLLSEGGMAGQTVKVPIQVSASGTAVPSNFQFDLNFDSTKLAFTSSQASTSLTAAGKSLATSMVSGNIRFTSSGANQTALPSGVVGYATLTLNAQFTSGGTLLNMLNCSSTNAQNSAVTTYCGTAIVEAGWCDVSSAGVIGATDLQAIINQALGISPPANDLTHDGFITVGDIQVVINAALGLGCPY